MTLAHYPDGRFREITPPTFDAQIPNWSPDGRRIVFQHSGDVWSIRPNGHRLTQLTFATDDTFSFAPSYSPDGTRIIFSRYTPRGNVDLYTMRPDGSRAEPLTRTNSDEFWAQWAPAGCAHRWRGAVGMRRVEEPCSPGLEVVASALQAPVSGWSPGDGAPHRRIRRSWCDGET